MRMKKKTVFSRIAAALLSGIMGMTTILSTLPPITASAATGSRTAKLLATKITKSYYRYYLNDDTTTDVYCLDYKKHGNAGYTYTTSTTDGKQTWYYDSTTPSSSGTQTGLFQALTANKKKALGYISYFGVPGNSTNHYSGTAAYMATQLLIWEIVEGVRSPTTFNFTSGSNQYTLKGHNTGVSLYTEAINSYYSSDFLTFYNYISAEVQKVFSRPAWSVQSHGAYRLTYDPSNLTYPYKTTLNLDNLTGSGNNRFSLVNALNSAFGSNNYTLNSSTGELRLKTNATKTINVTRTFSSAYKTTEFTEWRCTNTTSTNSGAGYSGYALVDAQRMFRGTLKPSADTVSLVLQAANTGSLKVNKVFKKIDGSSYSTSELASIAQNAKFYLKMGNAYIKVSGSAGSYTFNGQQTTKPAGMVVQSASSLSFTISGLPTGTYTLYEDAPASFTGMSSSGVSVTINTNSTTTKDVTNTSTTPLKGSVQFQKYYRYAYGTLANSNIHYAFDGHYVNDDTKLKTAIENTKFYLIDSSTNKYVKVTKTADGKYKYSSLGTTAQSSGTTMYTSKTKTSSSNNWYPLDITDLPYGTYKLVEVTSVLGGFIYETASSPGVHSNIKTVTINASNKSPTVSVSNNEYVGELAIQKTFKDGTTDTTTAARLAAAEFQITNSSGKYITATGSNGSYVYSGTAQSADTATTFKLNTSTKDFIVQRLPVGTYTIIETKTATDYELAKNVNVSVQFNKRTTQPVTNTKTTTPPTSTTTEIQLQKEWEINNSDTINELITQYPELASKVTVSSSGDMSLTLTSKQFKDYYGTLYSDKYHATVDDAYIVVRAYFGSGGSFYLKNNLSRIPAAEAVNANAYVPTLLISDFDYLWTENLDEAQKFRFDDLFMEYGGFILQAIPWTYTKGSSTYTMQASPVQFIEFGYDARHWSSYGWFNGMGSGSWGSGSTFKGRNREIVFKYAIKKVDENEDPLEGALIGMYYNGELVAQERTQSDGYAYFNNINLYDYDVGFNGNTSSMYMNTVLDEPYTSPEGISGLCFQEIEPPPGYKRNEFVYFYSGGGPSWGWEGRFNLSNSIWIGEPQMEEVSPGTYAYVGPKTYSAIPNTPILGKVRIHKVNEAGEPLSGVTFVVRNMNDYDITYNGYTVAPNGLLVDSSGNTSPMYSSTNPENMGELILTDLPLGKYRLEESRGVSAPYITLGGEAHWTDFEITEEDYDETVDIEYAYKEFTVVNKFQKVKLTVEKEGLNGEKLEGAKFRISVLEDVKVKKYFLGAPESEAYVTIQHAGDVIGEIVTNEDGEAYSWNEDGEETVYLPLYTNGKYIIEEIEPPPGYIGDPDPKPIEVSFDGTEDLEAIPYTVEFTNTPQKAHITVYKKDGDTNLPLAGARFELISDKDVTIDGVTYYAGSRIFQDLESDDLNSGTVVTNSDGKAEFPELPVGKYKIREVEAPENYTNAHEVKEVDATGDASIEYVEKEVTFFNSWQKRGIELYKYSSEGEVPLEGAVFEWRAEEDISVGDIHYAAGELIETLTTDTNGYAASSKTVPVGFNFSLTETQAPDRHELLQYPVYFSLDGEESGNKNLASYLLKLYNNPIYTTITVRKNDSYDGTKLAGAQFSLYAGSNDIYNVFGTLMYSAGELIESMEAIGMYTDNRGMFTFNVDLPVGYEYKIVETNAPENYKLNSTPYVFEVNDYAGHTYSYETLIDMSDEHKNGSITVFKKDSDEVTLLGGAVFRLKAAEDVTRADGSIIYHEGDTIGTDLTTPATGTNKGKVTFPEVPVGFKYKVIEISPPTGYVNADSNEQEFTLSDNVSVEMVEVEKTFTNKIQNIRITVNKVNADNQPLNGAKFALRATSKVQKPDGSTLYSANQQIGDILTTGANGTVTFPDVPIGYTYRVVEIDPPTGYIRSNFSQDVTLAYDATVANVEYRPVTVKVTNTPIKVGFIKRSSTSEAPLAGASLELKVSGASALTDSWVTTTSPYVISEIAAGTYVLTETKAPKGYSIADPITFTVSDTGTVTGAETVTRNIGGTNVICVVVDDDEIEFEIAKKNEDNGNVANATLRITDITAGNPAEGLTPTVTWSTTAGNKTFGAADGFMVNHTYRLEETNVPDGYVKANNVTFSINEKGRVVISGTVQATNVISMVDNYTKVKIVKLNENGRPLGGAVLAVYDGTTELARWTSNATEGGDGYHELKGILKTGKSYTIKEITAPAGYLKFASQTFTVPANGVISVQVNDEKTHIRVSKLDMTNNPLPDAKLRILDGNTIIEEWISGNTPHDVYGLTVNHTYTLREVEAPTGYNLAEDIHFYVNEDNHIVKEGTVQNDDLLTMVDGNTKIRIIKVDADDQDLQLSGAVLALYKADGTTLIEQWTTVAGEPKVFENLPAGTYILKELKAPKGYSTGDDMVIEVTNSNDMVTYKFTNKKGIIMPETGGKGTTVFMLAGSILLLGAAAYFVFTKKKRK